MDDRRCAVAMWQHIAAGYVLCFGGQESKSGKRAGKGQGHPETGLQCQFYVFRRTAFQGSSLKLGTGKAQALRRSIFVFNRTSRMAYAKQLFVMSKSTFQFT